LGVLASVPDAFIGSVYLKVRDACPGVRLQIVSGTSGRLAQGLEAGTLDVALLSRNAREHHARELVVGTVEHLLVGAPGDAITGSKTVPFEQLDGLPLVVPSRPYAFHHLLEHWAQRKNITLTVAAECDSLAIQKHLIARAGIYAIMAASAVRDDVIAGRLQASRIVSPPLKRKLVLLLSDAHPTTAASHEVLRIARSCSAMLESSAL
jgi:DNA-binding transcriptional LysR family regulator